LAKRFKYHPIVVKLEKFINQIIFISFMDTNEIFNYMKTGATWLAGGGLVYFTSIVGLGVASMCSERIKSNEQLERVIKEESEKLNLKNVIGIFNKNNPEISAREYTKNICGIRIGGNYATRCDVKHELYHIYKHRPFQEKTNKKKEQILNWMKYWFLEEPQAMVYEVFEIKL